MAEKNDSNQLLVDARGVSMDFNAFTERTDDLKEVVVKLFRGKLKKQKFHCLTDLTFQIRYGESVAFIGQMCIRDRDTGVGISEENLPHIFSRFYTVDKSHNGTGGGFGLGLAIVRKLCTRAGWKLSVESRLGEGTTFKIRFFPPKIL